MLLVELMENHSRFVAELTQSGMGLLGENQAVLGLMFQAPEAFNNGAEPADENHHSRRIRQLN